MSLIRFSPSGWQGRFDDEFVEENVIRLAAALAAAWTQRCAGARVYIGYDRRYRAEAFALLTGETLATFGLQAIVSEGFCPLPALAWQTARDVDAVGALMLTASESPCEYGGMIALGHDGGPVSVSFAHDVEQLVRADPIRPEGRVTRRDLVTPYSADLSEDVDVSLCADAGLRMVVDPMYGATSHHLYSLLDVAGCSVTEIHAEHREDFGGIHPEPMEPWVDDCEREVLLRHADVGFALDSDGDRAALIDERGRLIAPQNLAPLVLSHLVEDRGMSGRVVATLASSIRIKRQAHRLGLRVDLVPVGFGRIYGELLQGDVLLGCEEYGGICIPAHLPERDGMLVCLLILEMMAQRRKPLSVLVDEMIAEIGRTEYARRDVRLDAATAQTLGNLLPGINPHSLAGMKPIAVSHADGLRVEFADGAWGMARPSRAGNMVRIYAEALTPTEKDSLLGALTDLIRDPLIWRNDGEEQKQ
jgi:phosphomannomutase